jgi:phage gp45-like
MKRILFLLAVSIFAFQFSCFASITITKNSASIKIIPAGGGTPVTVDAGEPIPTIADGSTIKITKGNITVATTPPSTVTLSIDGNKIAMSAGSAIQVSISSSGAIKIFDSIGTASVTTLDGKTISMKQGQTIIITGKKVTSLEAYQPPDNNPGPQFNTQVQTEENSRDISPVT